MTGLCVRGNKARHLGPRRSYSHENLEGFNRGFEKGAVGNEPPPEPTPLEQSRGRLPYAFWTVSMFTCRWG